MDARLMPMTCHLGRGLSLVGEDDRGIELEGRTRLSPGRPVVIFGLAPAPSRGRRVYVASWRVLRVDHGGLLYRGYCEWLVE